MATIKTSIQIEKRIKSYCREINTMNNEFLESNDEATRDYLSRQISRFISCLTELKWVSGINYDKFIK